MTFFSASEVCDAGVPGGNGGNQVVRAGVPEQTIEPASDTLNILRPAGLANGDGMILTLSNDDDRSLLTIDEAWTFLGSAFIATPDFWLTDVYFRLVEPGEPASYNILMDGSAYLSAAIAAYTNLDQSAPVVQTTTNNGNSDTGAVLSCNVLRNGSMLVTYGAGAATTRVSGPVALTLRLNWDFNNYLDDGDFDFGATGNQLTDWGVSQQWSAIGVLLQPPP